MKLKENLINSIFIFIISYFIHFAYKIFPNPITIIFTSINESIFEHIKIIFTATIIYTLISNIFKKNNNIFLLSLLKSISTITILLILYLPINNFLKETLIITLIILFISIFLSETIINNINIKKSVIINTISLITIIIIYSYFTYLSYHPPKNFFFLDTSTNSYGINKKK